MSLWDVAVETADAMGDRAEGDYTLNCIVMFRSMDHAAKMMRGEGRRDILPASWGGTALLGHRTHNIVVSRRDFMEAVPLDIKLGAEQMRRHDYLHEILLAKLVPGGRIILV
jgi:hypothetical protein